MQLCLVVLGCGATLGVVALFGALRLELDARAFGEPSGSWAGAFGVGSSLGAVSGVWGRGLPLAVELHAFGRRFPLRRRKREKPRERADAPDTSAAPTSVLSRLERWLRSPPSLDVVLRAGRRVALDDLSLEASYGFRDIALTGKVAGVLYALQGALPAGVRVTQNPRWDGSERWELNVAGRITLYPTLVLLELLWYMLRARWRRAHSDQRKLPPAQLENPS